jgi:hypothetical protein
MKYINPYKVFVGSFIPNWLMCRRELSQGAKLAYARLCQYAGDKGIAFPKREVIAAEIGVSNSQFDRYIKELLRNRLVETDRPGLGRANRYRFIDHPWIKAKIPRPESAYMTTLESADMATPLKRIREDNHREEENARLDRIMYSPKQLKRAEQGIRSATAMNFGRPGK